MFTDLGSNTTTDQIAGVATSGVLIFNGVQPDNTDPFYPYRTSTLNLTQNTNTSSNATSRDPSIMDEVDKCLGIAYNDTGVYHYHMMSPCLYDMNIPAG